MKMNGKEKQKNSDKPFDYEPTPQKFSFFIIFYFVKEIFNS